MRGFGRALFIKSLAILSGAPPPRSAHLLRSHLEAKPAVLTLRSGGGAHVWLFPFFDFLFFKGEESGVVFQGSWFWVAARRQKYDGRNRCLAAAWLSWVGEGVAGLGGVSDLSASEGSAHRLGVTLSAPATSHLYCNANPRPVPDGAFPASWVHRNMIIYPEHFSSL